MERKDNDMVTYEVNVTPKEFDGLSPVYEVMIYRSIEAGICGPYTDTELVVGLDGVDEWLADLGFERQGPFGEVCHNGFATSGLDRV